MSSESKEIRLRIASHEAGLRLDRYLARQVAHLSRSRIQALMEAGLITLDGRPVKASHRAKHGEEVLIRLPGPEPSPLEPEAIPLDIRFEDEHLIVVDKPAGMVVHPAHGHPSGTLVNALLYYFLSPRSSSSPLNKGGRGGSVISIGGIERPGLVHRIDKDTSGLLVVAKSERALAGLAKQFKEKSAERKYRAIVWGYMKPLEGRIAASLGRSPRDRKHFAVVPGGKEAATRYRTLERFELFSLLELQLETGRTHQIRIHMQHAGHPVFGDPQYGGRNRRLGALTTSQRALVAGLFEILPRQALHAAVLGFVHPISGKPLRFESEFPEDIQAVLEQLRSVVVTGK